MKKFMFLHFGFEKPRREISQEGTKGLPWGMESITGYNIIEAEDLDAAEQIAKVNPYIASIRVYEIRSM